MMELALVALALMVLREVLAHRERQEWAKERRLLIMRVQAPELAVQLDAREIQGDLPPTPQMAYDDDDAYWQMRKECDN